MIVRWKRLAPTRRRRRRTRKPTRPTGGDAAQHVLRREEDAEIFQDAEILANLRVRRDDDFDDFGGVRGLS